VEEEFEEIQAPKPVHKVLEEFKDIIAAELP